ncbi:MAG TPA: ROK family transcriptional regulator [Actinomycetes bacterium]
MTVLARGSRGARSEDVRRGNLSTLLRYVHVHGPTARSRLTEVLGLNRSTIGDLTGDLVAAGLVREEAGRPDRVGDGSVSSSGGRPSYVVRPQSERVQVLAVDVGVTHLTVARVGLGGEVLARRDRAYPRGARRQRGVTSAIATAGAALLADIDRDAVVVAAGVAVPGMVRRRDGQVRQAPNLGWRDAPLGEALAAALGLPVLVGNDADLGMRAEHMRGAAAAVDDAVYLSGHSGIGAGIYSGGVPLGGRAGYAGEVGHIVVNPGGLPCHCGSQGCWETECGEERLFELAGLPSGGGLPGVHQAVAAAAAGDRSARAALEHVAGWLGRGTANVVNVLNPEVVILGGALEAILDAAGDTVRAAFATAALAAPLEQVRLVTPDLGPDSTLVGAAELAFDALLSDPLLELSRRTAS